eukprot:s192_g30.t1
MGGEKEPLWMSELRCVDGAGRGARKCAGEKEPLAISELGCADGRCGCKGVGGNGWGEGAAGDGRAWMRGRVRTPWLQLDGRRTRWGGQRMQGVGKMLHGHVAALEDQLAAAKHQLEASQHGLDDALLQMQRLGQQLEQQQVLQKAQEKGLQSMRSDLVGLEHRAWEEFASKTSVTEVYSVASESHTKLDFAMLDRATLRQRMEEEFDNVKKTLYRQQSTFQEMDLAVQGVSRQDQKLRNFHEILEVERSARKELAGKVQQQEEQLEKFHLKLKEDLQMEEWPFLNCAAVAVAIWLLVSRSRRWLLLAQPTSLFSMIGSEVEFVYVGGRCKLAADLEPISLLKGDTVQLDNAIKEQRKREEERKRLRRAAHLRKKVVEYLTRYDFDPQDVNAGAWFSTSCFGWKSYVLPLHKAVQENRTVPRT